MHIYWHQLIFASFPSSFNFSILSPLIAVAAFVTNPSWCCSYFCYCQLIFHCWFPLLLLLLLSLWIIATAFVNVSWLLQFLWLPVGCFSSFHCFLLLLLLPLLLTVAAFVTTFCSFVLSSQLIVADSVSASWLLQCCLSLLIHVAFVTAT